MTPEELAKLLTDDPDVLAEAGKKGRSAHRRARRKKERRRAKRQEREMQYQVDRPRSGRKVPRSPAKKELRGIERSARRELRRADEPAADTENIEATKFAELTRDFKIMSASELNQEHSHIQGFIDDLTSDMETGDVSQAIGAAELRAAYKAARLATQLRDRKTPEYEAELNKQRRENPPDMAPAGSQKWRGRPSIDPEFQDWDPEDRFNYVNRYKTDQQVKKRSGESVRGDGYERREPVMVDDEGEWVEGEYVEYDDRYDKPHLIKMTPQAEPEPEPDSPLELEPE